MSARTECSTWFLARTDCRRGWSARPGTNHRAVPRCHAECPSSPASLQLAGPSAPAITADARRTTAAPRRRLERPPPAARTRWRRTRRFVPFRRGPRAERCMPPGRADPACGHWCRRARRSSARRRGSAPTTPPARRGASCTTTRGPRSAKSQVYAALTRSPSRCRRPRRYASAGRRCRGRWNPCRNCPSRSRTAARRRASAPVDSRASPAR